MPYERPVSWRQLTAAGAIAAVILLAIGLLSELQRFGVTDQAAATRIAERVQGDFADITRVLSAVASQLASSETAARGLARGDDGQRELFDLLRDARGTRRDAVGITIYDAAHVARAWAGRPSDLPADRISDQAALFVTRAPLGLRLVYVQPILDATSRHVGSVAAESTLAPTPASAVLTPPEFMLPDPIAPVSVRMRFDSGGEETPPGAFLLRSPSGAAVAEGSVALEAIHEARRAWRAMVAGQLLACLAMTCCLLVGPLLDRRAAAADPRTFVVSTIAASALLLIAALLLRTSFVVAGGSAPGMPGTVVLGGVTAAALAALWAAAAARLRLRFKGTRRDAAGAQIGLILWQLGAGVVAAVILILAARVAALIVDRSTIDLRHFSLHPWNATRSALLGGLLAVQLAAVWAATLVMAAAPSGWRVPWGRWSTRALLIAAWVLPTALVVPFLTARGVPLASAGVLVTCAACAVAAVFSRRVVVWYRHATAVARILALFVAFVVPALLLYPSINFLAERATRRLITTQYSGEAQNHLRHLQALTLRARDEIDADPGLAGLVTAPPDPSDPAAFSAGAFAVWRRTSLNYERLTSAIELYDRSGDLVSRFGLNFPEYSGGAQESRTSTSCQWSPLFGEAQPFGSEERNMLHAERGVCEDGEIVGTVVVHVMLDYRNLLFISSQSPYFELFRASGSRAPGEGTPGSDVDVAIYGWGLHPIYSSARIAWPIDESLFQRLYTKDRAPFWADIERSDGKYRVYFSNDRFFIYAIGYPALTGFDHLVHLAELTTLAGLTFVLVLIGTAFYTRVARERPRVGRALLREIRASFYRKLFFAFVLAAVIPVLTLAFVFRAYFADLLRDAVQSEAVRTTAVARRVIQEWNALGRGTTEEIGPGRDDNVLVSISQLIEQDVNIFDGPKLFATSERDLFSSGFLPTRTPDNVYRAIVLDRLPSFVDEDQIGTVPYIIAAAPVRIGETNAILTVPLANRQREIEREIDDLDRGVHLAVLCFVLLGAGIGLWLAERIADPVRRLTRATRRIAAGDFDARIAVKSADELRRLVDSFNSMASELKSQRTQLERTHRLEAWAEMARQVAHEIKNPLTPIQLSAEHLLRVHADRGAPLNPVLEGCVTTILGQVSLLRQISAEFSNFASSPTARLVPTDLPALVAGVVDPYRTGLTGRIEIDNRVGPPLPLVVIDPTLITRALANMVENALHAMPGQGRLTLDAQVVDRRVLLLVRDTGVGMDAEALSRVFEPYFSTKTTGTGLGLPIARRNVELSGGTIEVESEKGAGTTVRVTLPAV